MRRHNGDAIGKKVEPNSPQEALGSHDSRGDINRSDTELRTNKPEDF
jgi:hypothetical protein